MELVRYLHVLRNRWAVLVAVVIVAMGAAWFLTPRHQQYQATSTLYVGSRNIDLKSASDTQYGAVAVLDRFITTFASMIHSAPVATRAIERTGATRSADAVVAATTSKQIPNTQLLSITVQDRDPATARQLANGIADAFVEQVTTFEPAGPATEGAVPTLPAYVFERARLPLRPQPTGLTTNVAVAAIIGLALGVAGVMLDDYLDITVRGIEDAERKLDLQVLGAIPDLGAAANTPVVAPQAPEPQLQELE